MNEMKVKFDIDTTRPAIYKDGQVSVKLPKSEEMRFKMLKAVYDKRLNEWARGLLIQLMDHLEKTDTKST